MVPFGLALLILSQTKPEITFDTSLKHHQSSGEFWERELTVRSGAVELAATLLLPKSASKSPAVVVCHGAERASRKSAYNRMLGQMLASNGIAALLFDKRGV